MRYRYFILLLILYFGCESKNQPDIQFEILAKVGDRIITLEDYINRTEYTLRPEYCRGNQYIHKKIILNNLIAEKLLAIESDSIYNEFKPSSLTSFIKGRKEQAMRQLLYFKEGYEKVVIENKDLNHYFKMAGRTYHVNYFTFPGGEFFQLVKEAIYNEISIHEIYSANFEGSIPTKDVNWIDDNDSFISNALFKEDVIKGQIIGPHYLNDGSGFILEIAGWTDRLNLSEKGNMDRKDLVVNTLREIEGKSIYSTFIKDVMKGKSINLNEEVFIPYANAIRDQFFRSKNEKESAISKALFGEGEFLSLQDIQPLDDKYQKLTLFSIEGDDWSVRDFEKNLASHPLVFRKKKMKRSEFPNQFKLSIVDFIQDYFLTKVAYDLELDKTEVIRLNESLWADSFSAYQSAKAWMSSQKDTASQHILMKPIVDILQKKYSSQISINMNLFESINITSVDMFVKQGNVPYPVLVPSFPSFTNDSYLDYGSKID